MVCVGRRLHEVGKGIRAQGRREARPCTLSLSVSPLFGATLGDWQTPPARPEAQEASEARRSFTSCE